MLHLLKRVERIIFDLVEKGQKCSERFQQMRDTQLEIETGINRDLILFYFKMKVLSFTPEKWRRYV